MRLAWRDWLPPPEKVAMPLAATLGLELLVNRVLTRTSLFLPESAAGPMAGVAFLGALLMAVVTILAAVALASVVVHGRGRGESRALVGSLLATFLLSFLLPSAATIMLVLAVVGVAAFALAGQSRPLDRVVGITFAVGLLAIAGFHLAGGGSPLYGPVPIAFLAGEILVLLAISAAGARLLRGSVRGPALAVATFASAFLGVLYFRGPAVFAAVAYWSLGYALVVPPLFFAALWFGLAGTATARLRGDVQAASLLLMLVAGIDVRVSYVAVAVVFAAYLRSTSAPVEGPAAPHHEPEVPRPNPQ